MSDLSDLVSLSREAGSRVDYVQAGGGNTSVKLDDGYMAIKASGYLLKEMTESYGFVAVDGVLLSKYFEQGRFEQPQSAKDPQVMLERNRLEQDVPEQTLCEHPQSEQTQSEQTQPLQKDLNKESMDIAIASIKPIGGEAFARPSVEIGFHSILQKFVLHLHPVYAAVLLCSSGGMEKFYGILEAEGIGCVMVPYIMPGYELTAMIRDGAAEYERRTGEKPKVILMKNHGVITTAQTAGEALALMHAVNNAVIRALSLPAFVGEFMPVQDAQAEKEQDAKPPLGNSQGGKTPVDNSQDATPPRLYSLRECADGYECAQFPEALRNPDIATACGRSALYPDQLVYIYDEVGLNEEDGKKITIGDRILYRSGEKEAAAMHETLLGVAYVHGCIASMGLDPELLSDGECAQILGWDSEKYRRSLMK